MTSLLRIDASARVTDSHSRRLGDNFEYAWVAAGPARTVIRRDLVLHPVAQIHDTTITGFYTPPDKLTEALRKATALSDMLIEELTGASELLITTPMYNFTAPAALKAWIDQIVRIGHTFSYDGKNFSGMLKTRRAVIVCAYGAGGYLDGGALAGIDFLVPYLKFLLGFLGIAHVEVLAVEATTGDAAMLSASAAKIAGQLEMLARTAA